MQFDTSDTTIQPAWIAGLAFALVIAALPLSMSSAAPTGDAKAGLGVFNRCAACHSTSPGVNKIGPSLAGIVGSKTGTVAGFNFSPAMRSADITWDANSLDKFLQNPNGYIHGTWMFFNVPSASDRQNVIAYLATLKQH